MKKVIKLAYTISIILSILNLGSTRRLINIHIINKNGTDTKVRNVVAFKVIIAFEKAVGYHRHNNIAIMKYAAAT
ncbi:MAG: hypothetical protein VB106_16590 [Clostridiaceae bacterium]|nr:hypothetical protein [Clostridiaceae bacterium]